LHRIRGKEFPQQKGTGSRNNLKTKKNVSNLENTQAQMRKGVLEFCILSIIAQGEVYPSDIIGKMKEAKLIVVEGTLYPLLTRLKNAGLLSYKWVESTSGPPRKYYSITPIGDQFLKELQTTWSELVEAVNQTAKNN
jgi:PadR family transcriptional regulator PadR